MLPLSDPILVFTILIFVMLTAPLLADRFKLPDLVLLLVAGFLLGPNGFGLLARDTAVTLFGSVGLLYIMFLAGLEIDMHRFSVTGRRSVIFGLITFAVPQGVGMLAGRYMLGFNWTASVLLASMFASHTLLSYPIASRLGISRSEPVAVTVGATIITDTLALTVLAVIADSVRGASLGLGFWLGLVVGMTVLILIIWFAIPPLTRWFFGNVTEAGGAQFLFVLVVICAFSYLSHFAKMESIIGAFLVGAAFNRLIPEHSVLMNRVVFVGNTLFIPFFLISVGMLVDTDAITADPRHLIVPGAMVVLVIATKYLAAWLGSAIFGYSRDERNIMFGLSVVQAAATLAAVLVGYELKIFDEAVFNGAIAMIAVTCPLGAWVVDRYGRRMSQQTALQHVPTVMEQRILVPVANPAYATRLLDMAFLLSDTTQQGAIYPVTIVKDDTNVEKALARSETLLAHCLTHASSAEISVTPSVRIDVNISDGIIRASKELRATMVLTGWGGEQTTQSRVFGSIMEKLVDACPVRILFCHLVSPLNTTRRLLLLLPPFAERRKDLATSIRDAKVLAKQIGVELTVYLTTRDSDDIRTRIESIRPLRPLRFVESNTLAEVQSRLFEEIGPDDMILVVSDRVNSILWVPTLDKLAESIASRFPGNNLLLAYPSLTLNEEEMITEHAETPQHVFSLYPCDLSDDSGFDEALRRMMGTAFPAESEHVEDALRLLITSAEQYPVELSDEAVLFHVHCEKITRPALVVGRGREWKEISREKPAYRIILALFSPKTMSAEHHLKALARIGRTFHNAAIIEKIHAASTAADICMILEDNGF